MAALVEAKEPQVPGRSTDLKTPILIKSFITYQNYGPGKVLEYCGLAPPKGDEDPVCFADLHFDGVTPNDMASVNGWTFYDGWIYPIPDQAIHVSVHRYDDPNEDMDQQDDSEGSDDDDNAPDG